jgi:hypothetical protein
MAKGWSDSLQVISSNYLSPLIWMFRLLDKMVPGSVPINTKRSQMSSNQNIQNFLHKCRELGFEGLL